MDGILLLLLLLLLLLPLSPRIVVYVLLSPPPLSEAEAMVGRVCDFYSIQGSISIDDSNRNQRLTRSELHLCYFAGLKIILHMEG